MKGYVLSSNTKHENSALAKPKDDIANILSSLGYEKIFYNATQSRLKRIVFGKIVWGKKLKSVDNTTFIFQYPIYSKYISNVIINKLTSKNNIYKILIVHDAESLRFSSNDKKKITAEIHFFNHFDCLIVHNDKMKAWLLENGVVKQMVTIKLFDYLSNVSRNRKQLELPLVYAGNLKKAGFLKDLSFQTRINVFGPYPSTSYPENVCYKGQYSPEKLADHLNGSFGLVWDGESSEAGLGIYGNYTRYNNPYKVSSYLASGLPVIVWNKSAISDFVRDNNIGLSVSSLSNLNKVISKISESQYDIMKQNVATISIKLRTGSFIKEALTKIKR